MRTRVALLAMAALAGTVLGQTRPRDPFVFRVAIRESGTFPSQMGDRLVAVLLNTNFTAFYSTVKGGLYMTRTGTAQDANTTYTQVQDGNVLKFTGGAVLHRNNPNASVWELMNGATAVTSQTVYRGYTLSGGATPNMVALRYAVVAGTTTVQISETPEYVAGGTGGIRRTFQISGLPAGQTLRLKVAGQVSGTEAWTAGSGGTVADGYFNITANGTAVLNGSW